MKKAILLLLLLNISEAMCQEAEKLNSSDIGEGIDRAEQVEKDLQQFADSLSYYSGGNIPSFLFDECFDWRKIMWSGFHSPISVRIEVLKRVSDREQLERIMRKAGRKLKKTCELKKEKVYPYLEVPDIDKSFYKLIKQRIRELR